EAGTSPSAAGDISLTSHGSRLTTSIPEIDKIPYSPFEYRRRDSAETSNIGQKHVPVVVADYMLSLMITHRDLEAIGYSYDADTDKWRISDGAADYIYTGKKIIEFALPGTLKVICDYDTWLGAPDKQKYFPLFQGAEYTQHAQHSDLLNFLSIDAN